MEIPIELSAYRRVLRMARSPGKAEFLKIAKISAAGIGLVGLLGFVIYTVMTLIHGVM